MLDFASVEDREVVQRRLQDAGSDPVELANPFWVFDSVGFRDPYGWTVVLTLES